MLKIQCSIERLLDRSSPVSTVTASAITAGYSSLTFFSRTFKQHTGSSPRDYRRKSFKARSVLLGLCGRTAQFEHRQSAATTPYQLTVRTVYPPDYRSDITFMGLFPTAIPKSIWTTSNWSTKSMWLIVFLTMKLTDFYRYLSSNHYEVN